MTETGQPIGPSRPMRPVLMLMAQGLCLMLAVYALFAAVTTITYYMTASAPGGTLQATLTPTNLIGRNHLIVSDLTPQSPLYAAGIRKGDLIDFDLPTMGLVNIHVMTEGIGLTRLTPAGPVHVTVYPVPVPAKEGLARNDITGSLIDGLTTLLSIVVGSLLVIRSRGSLAILMLGFAFIIFDCYAPIAWQESARWGAFPIVSTFLVQNTLAPIGFVAFAGLFFRENVGRLPRWATFGLLAFVGLLFCLGVMMTVIYVYHISLGDRWLMALFSLCAQAAYVVTLAGLCIGWRCSDRQLQKRYALMCLALAVVLLADGLFTLIFSSSTDGVDSRIFLAQFFSAFGHLLFGYAVLRHRVIDLGFAVNRTLVYGILSFLLLLAFGLIEWAVERFLPIEGVEANALLSGAIALGIFLIFHRVRDVVESFIEKLFFSRWHHNEAQLRRFVKQAAFIAKPETLKAALLAELTRFSTGGDVALYLAKDGEYVSQDSVIDGDDPSIVTMKAEDGPQETSEYLYLPMRHRAELSGFVRMGLKPSGDSFRPDEREVLAWAVHQTGLDLHALKVEALESRVSELDTQLAFLVNSGLAAQRAQG